MTWEQELVRIRRYLRDPDATIWTDEFLRHTYNDVQRDFQHKTQVLEMLHTQRVPGLFHCSYMHDWEYRFLSATESLFYQCLNLHDDLVFCHRWEPQERTGIDADVSDYGAHFVHPWEAYMGEVTADPIKIKFPKNLNQVKFIAYDESPIDLMSRKQVQNTASWMTREGTPIGYYPIDDADNAYVLYPKPSAAWVNEIGGDGVALYAQGDTEDVTTGTIAVRSGDYDSGVGAAVDIVDVEYSVFIVYEAIPTDMELQSDVSDLPAFLVKYIRHGVIARAYGANTDGRIKTLAQFWALRYEMGIQATKKFRVNRKQDRDYRMTSGASPNRRSRGLRLPDRYPAVNP